MTQVILREQAGGWPTYQLPDMIPGQRVWTSPLPTIAAAVTIADTAYFTYIGQCSVAFTAAFIRMHLSTVAVGTQAAEVALASTPLAPNCAGQTLTKIAANGTLDDLTSGTGLKKNTLTLATAVPAGTHLWLGFRSNMTGSPTQPAFYGVTGDTSTGQVLTMATAGALTGAGPWTGALVTLGAGAPAWQAPRMYLSID